MVIEVDASQEAATVVITGELDLTTRAALAERLTPVLRTGAPAAHPGPGRASFMDCGSARLIAGAGRFLPEGRA